MTLRLGCVPLGLRMTLPRLRVTSWALVGGWGVGPVCGPILFVSWLGSLAPHALGPGQRWVGLAGPVPLAGGHVSSFVQLKTLIMRFMVAEKRSPAGLACLH